jgi:hypothetical protein
MGDADLIRTSKSLRSAFPPYYHTLREDCGIVRSHALPCRRHDVATVNNALSALYPQGCEEKQLLDAMLLAVPR